MLTLADKNLMLIKLDIKNLIHLSVQNFKSIAQFLTPKWSVFVSEIIPIYDVIFSNAIFVTSGGLTQKQMTPLDS